jgi:uncharacterized protein
MPNRLAQETSPYLLQHRDNPVDWLPWGEEAFQKARAENKPVFLSIGYSSCHWCHVMAHESFEDAEVAEALNRTFVSVKVDREERPDVDEAYMTAVQLQTGRGGWPMSVFLTPERDPFFAGTYFPKNDRMGYLGFLSILRQLETMWEQDREKVVKAAEGFSKTLREALSQAPPQATGKIESAMLGMALEAFHGTYDPDEGGFGDAPKFPPHAGLEFLLRLAASSLLSADEREHAREMAERTLEKMCLGGIRDHVGGGFHRYSTDEQWLLPHFEKMLYDNALMVGNLALAGSELFHQAARETVGWLRREMVTSDGLLSSAMDADSEGEEGKFYVWRVEEVREILGERADAFLTAYGLEEEGNFRDEATQKRTGQNIPHLREDQGERFVQELELLRAARERRERPMRDDKALVGWNALAAVGLSRCGEAEWAGEIVDRLLAFRGESGLPHQVAHGRASGLAYLEDLAPLLLAMAELGRPADELWAEAQAFRAPDGSFFATSDRHEPLFGRTRPVFDHPVPSGNALLAQALFRLGKMDEAEAVVRASWGWVERAPTSCAGLLTAALLLLDGKADD